MEIDQQSETGLPPVLRVWPDLGRALQIGRPLCYELVRDGRIRSFKCGRNIRVSRDAVLDYISSGEDRAAAH